MDVEKIQSKDPAVHAKYMAKHIHDLKEHCRKDLKQMDDPRARALFETMAEVLGGIERALKDFQSSDEPAWR